MCQPYKESVMTCLLVRPKLKQLEARRGGGDSHLLKLEPKAKQGGRESGGGIYLYYYQSLT